MKICGLQKTTLLDYPGHMAATIFLGGCNFRCPYCHNSDLLGNSADPLMSTEELLSFLQKRRAVLEGVCITGGEPTMDEEALVLLISQIRKLGYLIKLDTNGSHPEALKHMHEMGLLDYVAMDIKSGLSGYRSAAGNQFLNLDRIRESISWLIAGTLPYEFRTTAVKGLHTAADFAEIGPLIAGGSRYYLQNYQESDRVLNGSAFSSFSREELLAFADLVKPYVQETALRGID